MLSLGSVTVFLAFAVLASDPARRGFLLTQRATEEKRSLDLGHDYGHGSASYGRASCKGAHRGAHKNIYANTPLPTTKSGQSLSTSLCGDDQWL